MQNLVVSCPNLRHLDVSFMCGDDCLSASDVSELVALAPRHPRLDVCCCGHVAYEGDEEDEEELEYESEDDEESSN